MKETNCRVATLAARLHEKVDSFLLSELHSRGIKDIQPCHGDILFYVGKHPGIGVSELAIKCHRTKSTIPYYAQSCRNPAIWKKASRRTIKGFSVFD